MANNNNTKTKKKPEMTDNFLLKLLGFGRVRRAGEAKIKRKATLKRAAKSTEVK